MELVSCRLREASMRYGEYSRQLGFGAVLDLDEVVGQRPVGADVDDHAPRAVRVRDLLEGRLEAFVPVDAPIGSMPPDGQDEALTD